MSAIESPEATDLVSNGFQGAKRVFFICQQRAHFVGLTIQAGGDLPYSTRGRI
jgi:hypothetical protein